MRWHELPRGDNIEERRGEDGQSGSGGFGLSIGGGRTGIGTIVVLGLVGWALGIDPRLLIGGAEMMGGRGAPYHSPDAFTHGSSQQRSRWFDAGLKAGTVAGCNTFAAAQL